MKLKPIVQQVVVVVGATSGIGLETAREFARKGARLVLAGRGRDDLEATLREIRGEGADGIIVEADVADWDQVNTIAQRAVETYGRIDTWAHVAGVSFYAKMEDTTPEEFRRVIEVNLNGPTYGVMAALPYLKQEGRGSIIIVSSVNARIPLPYQSAYVAAKHGLDGMIDSLRIELKHDGIPINLTNILPATIDTPFFDKARTKLGVKPGMMPPVYSARSVANAILYAAEHPVREISVGGASLTYQSLHRLSHRLLDGLIMGTAFKGQKTDEPRTVQAPNHLFQHLEGFHQVESERSVAAMPSKYTWLQLHPAARISLMGLLLGVPAGFMAMRILKGRKARNQNWFARLTEVAGITALLASFRRKLSFPRRVASTARDMLPENLFGRHQSFPRKVMSKAQDIFPKVTIFPQETFTERVAKRAKNLVPKRLFRRQQPSIPARVARQVRSMVTDHPVADLRDTLEERIPAVRR